MNEIVQKEEKEYEVQYYVVKNHEEQYSIWPTYKPIPRGWGSIGEARNKDACLKYIDEVWTDMRPLSLRNKMEEMEKEAKEKNDKNIYDVEVVNESVKKIGKKGRENKVDQNKSKGKNR